MKVLFNLVSLLMIIAAVLMWITALFVNRMAEYSWMTSGFGWGGVIAFLVGGSLYTSPDDKDE